MLENLLDDVSKVDIIASGGCAMNVSRRHSGIPALEGVVLGAMTLLALAGLFFGEVALVVPAIAMLAVLGLNRVLGR
jgi:hypothetical protein